MTVHSAGVRGGSALGWLFLLQVIAAFEARRNCRGIRQPVAAAGAPFALSTLGATRPRRLTGRAVCGRVGCRAYRRQRRDVALGRQCAGQGTAASVCPQTPAHGFLTGPDRAGMLGPGQMPCAGVVALRSACPWPVCRWSVRSRPCGAASPNPGSGAPARCGSHARSPCVRYVTAGTGPAIRSCAIGDEPAVRERCEFSHLPAGPLCSSSSQMTLRGLALCGCS